jgi:4-hydroxy-3-methylbut-2-enyl diphosphate reductase IspH
MSVESYYVVKTTSIVKATNKTKAKSILVGEESHGEILAQKVEVERKDQDGIAELVSKLDNDFPVQEDEDVEEENGNSYSSYLTVNEDIVNFLRS